MDNTPNSKNIASEIIDEQIFDLEVYVKCIREVYASSNAENMLPFPDENFTKAVKSLVDLYTSFELFFAQTECNSLHDIKQKLLYLKKEIAENEDKECPRTQLYFKLIDSCANGIDKLSLTSSEKV